MRIRTALVSAAASAALVLPAAPAAAAQDDFTEFMRQAAEAFLGEDDRRDYRDERRSRDRDRRDRRDRHDRRGGQHAAISVDEAIEIARANGMVRVTDVELDDDEWEIEGYDHRGREMEIEIDAYTGRVKDIDYD
ncbi:PepSY domain-containing protein [Glycocaulis profundi]|nr:PepSY domain-containing protein [Glycocaulis profundi]